jgi:hypothetical protein
VTEKKKIVSTRALDIITGKLSGINFSKGNKLEGPLNNKPADIQVYKKTSLQDYNFTRKKNSVKDKLYLKKIPNRIDPIKLKTGLGQSSNNKISANYKNKIRTTIWINKAVHEKLKIYSAKENTKISDYVFNILKNNAGKDVNISKEIFGPGGNMIQLSLILPKSIIIETKLKAIKHKMAYRTLISEIIQQQSSL